MWTVILRWWVLYFHLGDPAPLSALLDQSEVSFSSWSSDICASRRRTSGIRWEDFPCCSTCILQGRSAFCSWYSGHACSCCLCARLLYFNSRRGKLIIQSTALSRYCFCCIFINAKDKRPSQRLIFDICMEDEPIFNIGPIILSCQPALESLRFVDRTEAQMAAFRSMGNSLSWTTKSLHPSIAMKACKQLFLAIPRHFGRFLTSFLMQQSLLGNRKLPQWSAAVNYCQREVVWPGPLFIFLAVPCRFSRS